MFRAGQKLVVADVHKIRNKVGLKEKLLEGGGPNYAGEHFNEAPLAKGMDLAMDVREECVRVMGRFNKLGEAGRKMVAREPTHEALVKLIKDAPPSVAASSFGETMASLKVLPRRQGASAQVRRQGRGEQRKAPTAPLQGRRIMIAFLGRRWFMGEDFDIKFVHFPLRFCPFHQILKSSFATFPSCLSFLPMI